jgi:hypothetical protein
MAITQIKGSNIEDGTVVAADIKADSITNAQIKSDAAIEASKLGSIPASKLEGTLDLSGKTVTLPAAAVTAHAVTPTLDSPVITGTLSVLDGSTVTHTVANWSDDLSYTITPTNCTAGAVNASGQFVITHTSGTPSYTIKATTASLGLADSALVTKNIVMQLSAPTLSSPADVGTVTNVVYTITSTSTGDDKIILDPGTANFTYQSVSVGTASKVGNTVECIGFTTNNPAVTIQFTAEATYSVTAKSVNIAGTYGTSANSSADSITIVNAYPIDYLVIAGGGGGGGVHYAGGGGAGGYRNSYSTEASGGGGSSETALSVAGSLTVTVGASGYAGAADSVGGNGGNSVFSTVTAIGGGGGMSSDGNGATGGSGGGGGKGYSGGSGTANQGFAGGSVTSTATGAGGGGGGGASEAGPTITTAIGGDGGDGLASSITASAVTRGGGGGGAAHAWFATAGQGGAGGGGIGGGGSSPVNAESGTVNTGSGGGGGNNTGHYPTVGAGGSGVVILRMLTSDYSGTTTGVPTVDSSTVAGTTILTFNGDGSYTT